MSNPISSVEAICNLALHAIGETYRIGNIWEGSIHSVTLLDIYAQTRDELLRKYSWEFAERNLSLVLLKVAPPGGYNIITPWSSIYPSPPWLYEYTYPDDCLKVRSIRDPNAFLPSFDPQPQVFSINNDNTYTPQVKVICCNVQNAVLTYTAQVTDITTWEPLFIQTLVDTLAAKISVSLSKITQSQDEDKKLETAETINDSTSAIVTLG